MKTTSNKEWKGAPTINLNLSALHSVVGAPSNLRSGDIEARPGNTNNGAENLGSGDIEAQPGNTNNGAGTLLPDF